MEIWKHQRLIRQLDKSKINRHAIRYAGSEAQVLFAFSEQQSQKRIVNRDGPLVCRPLRLLEPLALFRFLQRPLNAKRPGNRIKIGPAESQYLVATCSSEGGNGNNRM